jgi:3-oxoacyl-[acyl-carrier protein] reductase
MSLDGKVVLITGASRGIGKAIASRLARDGASVVINFSNDPTPANQLVKQLGEDKAIAIKADVSKVDDVKLLVKETIDKWGKIDILVNCAGVLPMCDLKNTSEEQYDKTFAINVKGPYFLTQVQYDTVHCWLKEAVKYMSPGSRVIFFSSSLLAASTITPPYLLYAATKGAIEQMTRVLAKDLGKQQINVNVVSPGPTGTDLFLKGKSDELIKMIASGNPYGRLGEPEEMADVVTFLSSSDSRWVNGQNIRINGGMA